MRVLILGGDGYLGWPTAMYLSLKGYDVAVVDNYFRRQASRNLNVEPLIPVPNLHQRAEIWRKVSGKRVPVAIGDITDYHFLSGCFTGEAFKDSAVLDLIDRESAFNNPDAVIHYAEQPSAPYSMMGRDKAVFTLSNNLIGTANLIYAVQELRPECHIVKLGTMGVYGTPNIDIEEGYLDVEHKGRTHRFLYPKTPGSLYHLTKSQDSDMLYFYCRIRDIRVTDLNQGPVYGIFTDESRMNPELATIFNYDDIFGTVLNRFLVQAVVGFPLTVYGNGGQTRGYLNIVDTMACVELAVRHTPEKGEYKVYNQVVETFSVNELAEKVCRVGRQMGLNVEVKSIPNPRREAEEHYYNPVYTGLRDLGLEPHLLTDDMLSEMVEFVIKYKDNINKGQFLSTVSWA